jgi:transposase-like protein
MKQKTGPQKPAAEQIIKDIRRATRKHHSAEDKIRIVLEGLRGEESIAALCRREGSDGATPSCWSEKGSNETPSNFADCTIANKPLKSTNRRTRNSNPSKADLSQIIR